MSRPGPPASPGPLEAGEVWTPDPTTPPPSGSPPRLSPLSAWWEPNLWGQGRRRKASLGQRRSGKGVSDSGPVCTGGAEGTEPPAAQSSATPQGHEPSTAGPHYQTVPLHTTFISRACDAGGHGNGSFVCSCSLRPRGRWLCPPICTLFTIQGDYEIDTNASVSTKASQLPPPLWASGSA